MRGFRERFLAAIPLAYAEAEKAPGFVAHAYQVDWDDTKTNLSRITGLGACFPCRGFSTEPGDWE
jgi:hypothetical protein